MQMNFKNFGSPIQLRVALLGNPVELPEWTPAQLQGLVDVGFNAVQLNIAWLCRPADEALNLRDVVTLPGEPEEPRVAERREQLLHRNRLARAAGMRTIFHFGSPFMWRNPYTDEIDRNFTDRNNHNHFQTDDPWYDTLNPLVVEHEVALLKEFRRQFPDVDDILVYTYDQDTWKPKEFGNSKYSRGIPLHERLPEYLATIHRAWTEGREQKAMMWWEPWELSSGQVYKCLPALPRNGFGLMLHNNIAEAQIARPVDVWFRNTARMCMELGIPVVGEGFFGSMTEEVEPLFIPCPRLVDEQFLAMTSVAGVVGIKEYFGVLPLMPDPNLEMLRLRLANPSASTSQLFNQLVAPWGEHRDAIATVYRRLADAMQVYPWDATWFARSAGRGDIDHGWSAATVRGQICETPSWDSSRRAHFMMTDDHQPHPFLLEDVQLRLEIAIEYLNEVLSTCQQLINCEVEEVHGALTRKIVSQVEVLRRVACSYALHLRETNVAQMLRDDLDAGRPMLPRLLDEMASLLDRDVENQHRTGRVVAMRDQFKADPADFIRTRLLPTEESIREKGYHTFTTR